MVARNMLWVFFSGLDASFLRLMEEKKQKKIKTSTEAGEVGRVHDKSNRLPANWAAYLSHLVGGSDAALAEEFVEIGDGFL